ncbi:succinate dehydrogenase, cytochrome b556 subunit [Verminephrobacter eiseniae]|uniref:succinate dehydrogenase, cytochrome b556 subunit n=1 Tax=Verminephrobacter eiseniae TaxID=364317 RepID=UPI0010EC2A78|nr:succinate dehydrogenase, cytochrome b556 subunit [Verminephrobacter eiseniae]KAB7619344.1 succinate dehydrogenase, cytochrome b556 subunit [Verminephrobacter sp. Larva24]MCW5230522.1 succinate dehydrogenase, cytochrome b556 subunit [Verminephrobacter eiseniae]MCW5292255.1 succinate dehydrogenase, cytochrome b556 subunit [Verminephrobacter eiseniae]MCW8187906.1 succinate dehydrogenase, cytochrome b556 subunit [Verminephrobacter eiseniae]MCW8224312.1 succinate dehydrogenase, cytochrome b556 s
MTKTAPERPEFRNLHPFQDLRTYRLPAAGWVSFLHRVSGLAMFLLLPFIVWMFDTSLSSEISFARFTAIFKAGAGVVPGWCFKLLALALIWSFLHHFCAGLRHLWLDIHHAATTREFGRRSALAVLALSLALTLVLGAKLFGMY